MEEYKALFYIFQLSVELAKYLGERLAYIQWESSECKEWKENITNLSA